MEQPQKIETEVVYLKQYRHYRTGKIMIASDYGYTVWRFLIKKKRK